MELAGTEYFSNTEKLQELYGLRIQRNEEHIKRNEVPEIPAVKNWPDFAKRTRYFLFLFLFFSSGLNKREGKAS